MDGPKPSVEGHIPEREALQVPPGDFVSADLQSDCARFLAELRRRNALTAKVEWTLTTEEE